MPNDNPELIKVLERLATIEAGMSTLIEQTTHVARMSESITRMQERDEHRRNSIDELFEKADSLEKHSRSTDAKVDKWVNRGLGAYAAATVLVTVITFLLFRVVGEYEARIRNYGDMIVTMDRRLAWAEFELNGRGNRQGDPNDKHPPK